MLLGGECPSVEVQLGSDEEKEAYVYRVNLNRRQLSQGEQKKVRAGQRRLAGLLIADRTQEQVAAHIGVAQNTVSRWLADATNIPPDNGSTIDHRKKLTEADDAEIAERLDAGETQEQVAADLGSSLPSSMRHRLSAAEGIGPQRSCRMPRGDRKSGKVGRGVGREFMKPLGHKGFEGTANRV